MAIAKEIAVKKPIPEIMNDWNISRGTIRNIKQQKKELIETESARLLEILPDIIDQTKRNIQISNSVTKVIAGEGDEKDQAVFDNLKSEIPTKFGSYEDIGSALKYVEIGRAEKTEIMKAVGILPSNTQSIMIQNIYNDNRQQVLSTSVESIVTKLFGGATGHSTTDNEPVDTESTEIIVDNQ